MRPCCCRRKKRCFCTIITLFKYEESQHWLAPRTIKSLIVGQVILYSPFSYFYHNITKRIKYIGLCKHELSQVG